MKRHIRWLPAVLAAVLVCAGLALGGCRQQGAEAAVPSGWTEENGARRFLDSQGSPLTGWQELDGSRYYFSPEGLMATSWQEIDGCRYYFGEDGAMVTLWQDIGGNRYYFGSDGALQRGWLELENGRYYLDDGGAMVTGWQEIDGQRRCFDDSGLLRQGWLEQDGAVCYLDDGAAVTGWQEIDGQRYFFGEDGTMVTGWLQEGEYRYYLQADGSAAVGPTEIDGETYYFSPSGIHIWLVNPWNFIHEDYEVELVVSEYGCRVASICKDALDRMLRDCQAAGHSPVLCAGYRSYWDQYALYQEKIAEYGVAFGSQVVAVPNTSEHQLGLAVDIVDSYNRKLNATQADTALQQWLMEHCWEYGFILRYPTDSTDITGIIFEPWHYRYVGVEVSMELRDLGITLEEYLGAADHE